MTLPVQYARCRRLQEWSRALAAYPLQVPCLCMIIADDVSRGCLQAYKMQLLCCRTPVTVTTIYRDEAEVAAAKGGENLRLRLAGVDEDDISPGFVLCSRQMPVPAVTHFEAQLQLLDLLEHKSIFTAGGPLTAAGGLACLHACPPSKFCSSSSASSTISWTGQCT